MGSQQVLNGDNNQDEKTRVHIVKVYNNYNIYNSCEHSVHVSSG